MKTQLTIGSGSKSLQLGLYLSSCCHKKYHRLSGLNNIHSFFSQFQSLKSKSRGPACLILLCLFSWLLGSCHLCVHLTSSSVDVGQGKDQCPTLMSPTLMTSFNLNCLLTDPIFKNSHQGVKASTYEWQVQGTTHNSVPITVLKKIKSKTHTHN